MAMIFILGERTRLACCDGALGIANFFQIMMRAKFLLASR